jgi:hypothetical protein
MKRREFINTVFLSGVALGIGGSRLFAVTPISSEDLFTPEARAKLKSIYDKAIEENWRDLPFGDLVGKVAIEFVGTPYQGGTLDGEPEICRVILDGLDCVTFFESLTCNCYNGNEKKI